MDERGNMVYHPQQQLLYAGPEEEEAWPSGLPWRRHLCRGYRHLQRPACAGQPWRVVGVSYIDETVNESFWQMARIAVATAVLDPAGRAHRRAGCCPVRCPARCSSSKPPWSSLSRTPTTLPVPVRCGGTREVQNAVGFLRTHGGPHPAADDHRARGGSRRCARPS